MKEKEGEGLEEWDADFLDQLIQVEELALSSQLLPSSSSKSPLPTTNLPSLPPQPQPQRLQHDYQNNSTSYSPPRELSQRPIEFSINNNSSSSIVFDRFSNGFSRSSPSTCAPKHNAKDLETDRLKRELGRASKHLTDLEQQCFELKKERRKRDEQINSLYADTEEKYVDIHSQKKTNFGRECGVPSKDAHGISQHCENAKPLEGQIDIAYTSKAIGVQTERSIDFTKVELNNDLPSHLGLSETLLGIWGSTSEQQLGRNLISKLFMACPTDFQVLFGCMSMNMSSKVQMDYLQDERSSHAALQYHMCSFPTSEAAKVSHLYSVLTKVAILSSSLHILLVYLKQLLSLGAKSGGDNIKIEGLRSEDCLEGQDLFRMISYETSNAGCSSLGIKSIYPKHLCKKRCLNADISLPLSSVNWVLLFEMMLQIAVSNTEECVILEAISIMNVILMSSNAQTETEKFGQSPVFESIAPLLRMEAGLRVQKEALHLLFLLLNCSKLLSIFCSGCKMEEIAGSTNNKKNTSTPKGFSSIFVALAECIACSGNSIQDIELRSGLSLCWLF